MHDEPSLSALVPGDPHLLRSLIDTAGSVILALRPDHTIFEWNLAAEELFGVPRSAALGLNYVERFLAPEFREPVAADIRKVLAGTPTRNFEDDQLLPDGRRRTLIWNVTRVLDGAGLPVGIVAIGQDITERKEAERKFRLVFEHTSEGLLLGDFGGVIDCNPAALRLLGLSDKAELLGRHPAEFSPPTQPDGQPSREKARALDRATRERGCHQFEWMHRRVDGTEVPVEVTVTRAPCGDRDITVAAWHDLTERRAMEAEQAELQRRLAQAQKMEAVGQLAGGVAHDFNNLLTAISGSLELALLDLDPAHPASAELATAVRAAERAADLTRKLLAFSRRNTAAPAVVDLGQLVQDLEPILRRTLPAEVTLATLLAQHPAAVLADRSQLEQVVMNLALNGRDAMPGGGTLTLEVRRDDDHALAILTVQDTGHGMDEVTRGRIFEPFFTTKPVGQGVGLGLAVVYGVVTQWGGTVRVRSAPGAGSEFVIELPLAEAADLLGEGEARAVPPGGNEMVLLVEDEAAVRGTSRRLLERFGYLVLEARHGADALELWRAMGPRIQAVITDVRMPEMNGVQLAQVLRAQAPRLPILFVSGYDQNLEDRALLPAGASTLQKPFNSAALLRQVRELLDASTVGAAPGGGAATPPLV